MEKAAFLDTMIFLHFKALEEVDWNQIVSADTVRIVVPKITIRELDKHKDTHASRKIRERALRALRKIEDWAQAEHTDIRPGVNGEVFQASPSFPLQAHDLDPERNDDVLIASVLEFRIRNPETKVVLVTQDTTPRITARGLGIEVFQLPDELKLPAETDPVELENRELRKRISRFESALPKLLIGFRGESGHVDRMYHQCGQLTGAPEAKIEERLRAEIAKFPASKQDLLSVMYSPQDVQRYEKDRADYVKTYRDYLIRESKRQEEDQLIVRIQTEVHNIGSAPAEDIDVELEFPSDLLVFSGSKFQSKPLTSPTPPRPPRTMPQVLIDSIHVPELLDHSRTMASILAQPARSLEPPNVSKLTLKDNVASFHIRRLKHDYLLKADKLVVIFKDAESMRNFSIDYRLHTGSLPDQFDGKLHVIMKRD